MKKNIKVDLGKQRLTALSADSLIYDFPCVTGDATHPTPKGKFKILQKRKVCRSVTYNAQMNYALQINNDGIYIHESYNYSEDPAKQSFLAKAISDTAAPAISHVRAWFPSVGQVQVKVGNTNLTGSHGCIRLAHSDAVRLFEWAEVGIPVIIQ